MQHDVRCAGSDSRGSAMLQTAKPITLPAYTAGVIAHTQTDVAA